MDSAKCYFLKMSQTDCFEVKNDQFKIKGFLRGWSTFMKIVCF